jgi:hypothetical protein
MQVRSLPALDPVLLVLCTLLVSLLVLPISLVAQ